MFTFIGNFIWFICGGLVAFLLWFVLGCVFAVTIIGFPFAIAAWRISVVAAFPFGKELVDARTIGEDRVFGSSFVNFLWVIFAGLWLSIFHIIAAIACFLSFILIFPIFFGIAHLKLAVACFAPLGKRIIYNADVLEQQRRMNMEIERMANDPYNNNNTPATAPKQIQNY